MNSDIENELCEILGSDNVKLDEPMNKHTTFRIGGLADVFLSPHSIQELQRILQICAQNSMPVFVMGNGSNLLVSDKGYRGIIIQLYRNFSSIEIRGNEIWAQSGALLSSLSRKAMEASLTGLEFAGGIPGTLGGAVVMNAGAYDGEMRQILRKVTVLTREGEVRHLDVDQLELGYRTSVVKKHNYIVTDALLELSSGRQENIQDKMKELAGRRTSKQPLEYPSAGSTFKRPEGYFAGKLIMDSGLSGYSVGGAQVSEKHCGFVINAGEASATDVKQLIEDVQKKVHEDTGILLETEVKFLGDFS